MNYQEVKKLFDERSGYDDAMKTHWERAKIIRAKVLETPTPQTDEEILHYLNLDEELSESIMVLAEDIQKQADFTSKLMKYLLDYLRKPFWRRLSDLVKQELYDYLRRQNL